MTKDELKEKIKVIKRIKVEEPKQIRIRKTKT